MDAQYQALAVEAQRLEEQKQHDNHIESIFGGCLPLRRKFPLVGLECARIGVRERLDNFTLAFAFAFEGVASQEVDQLFHTFHTN